MKPLISLHDLAVGYGAKPVLEGLRVEIAQGSFTALLGTNGSGKTTLLKKIVGILPPLAGRVEFHEANGRAPVLGYVPQRETLDPIYLLSSAEVVLMGTYGRLGAGRLPDGSADLDVERLGQVAAAHKPLDRAGELDREPAC